MYENYCIECMCVSHFQEMVTEIHLTIFLLGVCRDHSCALELLCGILFVFAFSVDLNGVFLTVSLLHFPLPR
jgi:hypothetical protein